MDPGPPSFVHWHPGIKERAALDSQGQPVEGPSQACVLEAAFFQSLSFGLFHISKEDSVNIDTKPGGLSRKRDALLMPKAFARAIQVWTNA